MESDQKHKSHQKPHSGRKADKKSSKRELNKEEIKERKRNPKAFAIQNAVKADRLFRHKQDKLEKKYHIPQIDRTPVEPPPVVVSVIGPAKVGKSTLIRNLVRHFSGKNINEIRGPVTCVAGKHKRFTFFECNNDINNMIDLAKISDISLLLIDASFGFEMETFEYLNICKAHGEHRIMGVLTHLDQFNKYSKMKKAKKELKRRFWTEVYAGAKLFYLSRIAVGNEYVRTEIKNLARFLTVYKLQPVQFRQSHPYMLVDRFEDLTNAEDVKKNELMNRNVVLYGYSRGSFFKPNQMVHIAGVGDMAIDNISFLPDPCELPEVTTSKRKLLSQKEKLVYSPFSGIGGILYDKDAVYIDLGTSHFHRDNQTSRVFDKLSKSDKTIDEKMAESSFKVFNSEQADEGEDAEDSEAESDAEPNDLGDEEESDEEELDDEASDDEELSNDEQQDAEMDDEQQLEENDNYSFDDDSSDEDAEEDAEEDAAGESWRANIAKRASDTFYKYLENTDSIQKLVYGQRFELQDDREEPEDEQGFNIDSTSSRLTVNGLDSTKFELKQNRDWESEEVLELIKDCFVTGKWTEDENADILLRENEDEMEEYGDFEDLEMENDEQPDSQSDDDEPEDSLEQKRRMEKKRKLKEQFDSNYDDKLNSDGKKKDADGEDDDEGPEEAKFYREIKKKLERQAQINKSEFEGLNDELRVKYEGFRPGMYIRIQLKNMPCEFVKNFDPHYPVIVGGLLSGETNVGFLQVRIKKHRWYPKILKTKNPLIISLGWRRFQTLPIYSMQDHNGRDRCLKYTPQHLHCYASFYGPITPQNTGFVAIQDCADFTNKFRLAATGTVLNLDKSLNLVKKLKVVGHPMKIYRKTAFVQGMFNSTLEATKFEGALIKTVSGIRGHIKKALSKPEGSFRAAFEDKILLSDIVFLRTWYTVQIPEFYYPVCNLLLSAELKMKWKGMKTVGEVRHEMGISVEQNQDSFYKIMARKNFNFKPLVLPKGLEKELPYKSKVKHLPKKENKLSRVAVVREPKEQKIADLQKRIRAMYKESQKMDKRHALVKKEKNRAIVQAKLKKREESIKKRKKAFCKRQSMNGGGRKFKK